MTNWIELDPAYSTTRRVRKVAPEVVKAELKAAHKSEDQFQTILFQPEGEGRKGEGGLRTQGYFKLGGIIPSPLTEGTSLLTERTLSSSPPPSPESKPLITVVTVVYNGEKFLEDTILSVINQTYDNVEYIIIDGGSTDGTLEIIKKYEHAIDYWVSEKDKGIYDAMNKGIDLATGEWINFMNGGDAFYEKTSIKKVFDTQYLSTVDIVYGNHQVVYPSGRKRYAKAGQIKNFWKGSQFCHQASFVKTAYHKVLKFNLCTKIAADFEFFYKAWKTKKVFQFADVTIARFEAGGISDVNRIDSILGWWVLVDKSLKINTYYCLMVIKENLKSKVKRFV